MAHHGATPNKYEPGLDTDRPDDEDYNSPEIAHRLHYDAEVNQWESQKCEIRVGKEMFAWGEKAGCILVQDLSDGETYVLKKPFDLEVTSQEVYDKCKVQQVAQVVGSKFNALRPGYNVEFIPFFVYILAQRPNQPAVLVEPLVLNHMKEDARKMQGLSVAEIDAIEAFEHFSFHMSSESFLLCNPKRIADGRWTEPEFHSIDGEIGGELNWGKKELLRFQLRHHDNTMCRMLNLCKLAKNGAGQEEEKEEEKEEEEEHRPLPAMPSTPRETTPRRVPPGVTGLGLVQSEIEDEEGLGDGKFVHSIVKGTPAYDSDAFRVGDRLLFIDGKSCDLRTLEEVQLLLAGPAGTVVVIEYQRLDLNDLLKTTLTRREGKVVNGRFKRLDEPDEDPIIPVATEEFSNDNTVSDLFSTLTAGLASISPVKEAPRSVQAAAPRAPQGVVGKEVPPSVGLRVQMLHKFMYRGRGRITSVNDTAGYVSVKWDDGSVDPCLHFKDEQYLRTVLK